MPTRLSLLALVLAACTAVHRPNLSDDTVNKKTNVFWQIEVLSPPPNCGLIVFHNQPGETTALPMQVVEGKANVFSATSPIDTPLKFMIEVKIRDNTNECVSWTNYCGPITMRHGRSLQTLHKTRPIFWALMSFAEGDGISSLNSSTVEPFPGWTPLTCEYRSFGWNEN
ncbi:MAG: hypothetical protein KBC69_00770 [Candidatus Magasanikbacteria bacterium]|nr:hypothetical protein [Candidatus Magasanikbacteria bacterium]